VLIFFPTLKLSSFFSQKKKAKGHVYNRHICTSTHRHICTHTHTHTQTTHTTTYHTQIHDTQKKKTYTHTHKTPHIHTKRTNTTHKTQLMIAQLAGNAKDPSLPRSLSFFSPSPLLLLYVNLVHLHFREQVPRSGREEGEKNREKTREKRE